MTAIVLRVVKAACVIVLVDSEGYNVLKTWICVPCMGASRTVRMESKASLLILKVYDTGCTFQNQLLIFCVSTLQVRPQVYTILTPCNYGVTPSISFYFPIRYNTDKEISLQFSKIGENRCYQTICLFMHVRMGTSYKSNFSQN